MMRSHRAGPEKRSGARQGTRRVQLAWTRRRRERGPSEVIVVLLALAACGDNKPDPRPSHSGERIKLRYYEYADGTRVRDLAQYHDTTWNEPCRAVRWSDGARYCTPPAAEAFYTDPACKLAVGRSPTGDPPPRYFTTYYSVQGMPFPSGVHAAGERTEVPPSRWFLEDGLCKGPLVNDGAYDYYLLGAKLADPARIKRSEPRGDGDLLLVDDYSDDGLQAPVGFFDASRGECVTAERANADSVSCVPLDSALATYFHDGLCSEPLLTVSGSTVPGLVGSFDVVTGCQTFFPVVAELLAPQTFQNIAGTCTEVQPPNGVRFYSTGARIELPALVREREVADRRLRRIDRVSGALRLEDTLVYDSELDSDCAPSGGVCAPIAELRTTTFFTDDTCATAVELVLVPSRTCDAPARFAVRGGEVVPINGPYTAPFYELSTGDTCRPFVPPTPYTAHAVGEPIARERLVPFTVVAEP